MQISFTNEELEQFAGEVLPQRAVLSTPIVTPIVGSGGGPGAPGGQGTTALSACNTSNSPGTPGLLGSLGLGSANPGNSLSCTPGAISGH